MQEAKHTPGIWVLEHDSAGWLHVRMPESLRYEDDWCFQSRNPSEEDIANARLIAAAPELLAALQLAEDLLGRTMAPSNGTLYAFEKARAAIAKATAAESGGV